MNFQDLIASNISEEVEYAEEARFSFIKGAYMEDSHPQGIHFVFPFLVVCMFEVSYILPWCHNLSI